LKPKKTFALCDKKASPSSIQPKKEHGKSKGVGGTQGGKKT